MFRRGAGNQPAQPPGEEEILSRVPLFRYLKPEQKKSLLDAMERRSYPADAVVTRGGQPLAGLHVILAGAVAMARPDGQDARSLGVGDYFGELAVLEPRPAAGSITTTEATECLVLQAARFGETLSENPDLALPLLRTLGQRVNDAGESGGASTAMGDPKIWQEQIMRYAADLKQLVADERERRRELRDSILSSIKLLVQVGESKDPSLVGHGVRSARYAQVIAQRLGWEHEKVTEATLAGLMHDIGIVMIDTAVLRKREQLTDQEWAQVQSHPAIGARILSGIEFLKPMVPYVLCHHERVDGRGYPQGLRGRSIPSEGRLMAAVELLDSLLSPTQDQPPQSARAVIREINHQAGRVLDPEYARAIEEAIRAGEIAVPPR